MFKLLIYMLSFVACLYGIMALPFHKITNKDQPLQTMVLILVLAIALAYLVASFLCDISIYNGL